MALIVFSKQADLRFAQRRYVTHMSSRLYVGNLSFSSTNDSIRDAFAQHGTVTDVHLVLDRESGRSRGFAFVTMGNNGEASTAIAAMNGAMLDGRALRVNEAEERQQRSGGGGGGGGGDRRGGSRW
jgi:RNA recognition motif-containing protein